MIHVHVRKSDGTHLLDADAYRSVISAIGAEVGDRLVIQITSEALAIYQPDEQMAVVRATRPEAVSLALRELLPDTRYETKFAEFLLWLKKERVLPQIILYDPDEAKQLADIRQRGIVPWDEIPALFVLGRYSKSQTSLPRDILPFLAPGIPQFSHWSVCAFGRHETACVTTGALLGGHVRVGFENNLWCTDGSVAASNADLVQGVKHALDAVGITTQDSCELRQTLNLLLEAESTP